MSTGDIPVDRATFRRAWRVALAVAVVPAIVLLLGSLTLALLVARPGPGSATDTASWFIRSPGTIAFAVIMCPIVVGLIQFGILAAGRFGLLSSARLKPAYPAEPAKPEPGIFGHETL